MAIDLSVIIPVHNEEQGLDELKNRLIAALEPLNISWNVLFVNDGSRDRSLEILRALSAKDNRFRVLDFSRNFGHQIAITAGLDHAEARACVIMDADLQDPPELINPMLAKWREGFEIVYAVRSDRKGESFLKRATAKLFYAFLRTMADVDIPMDAGDFRLLDRKVVDQIKTMREYHRLMRGMVSWIGFRQTSVSYPRDARWAGKTHYSMGRMIRLALDGLTGFSLRPLQAATVSGFVFSGVGFVYGLYALYVKLFTDHAVTGWTSLVIIIVFLGGIQLITIGIIGEYVGRILDEVKKRPLYIIRERIGF